MHATDIMRMQALAFKHHHLHVDKLQLSLDVMGSKHCQGATQRMPRDTNSGVLIHDPFGNEPL